MSLGTLLAIAVALAMDAFAVAVAAGVSLREVTGRQTFRLAWHFGLFQAIMPVAGWALGQTFSSAVKALDHWLAFGLLAAIGLHMLWGSWRTGERPKAKDPTRGATLVVLSVATSLDALAVGLSLSLLQVPIWWPALVIGAVATTFTAAGLQLGRLVAAASRMGVWAEAAGGLVLLAIGVRILAQHGVF
jgi:putative Mn2+ efflux pump MntP